MTVFVAEITPMCGFGSDAIAAFLSACSLVLLPTFTFSVVFIINGAAHTRVTRSRPIRSTSVNSYMFRPIIRRKDGGRHCKMQYVLRHYTVFDHAVLLGNMESVMDAATACNFRHLRLLIINS